MQVIRTYSFRIKDSTSKKRLKDAAGSVNFVWNDLNHTSHRAIRERSQWWTAYDLDALLSDVSKVIPELHSQTFQALSKEYVKARKLHKKVQTSLVPCKKEHPQMDSLQIQCSQMDRGLHPIQREEVPLRQ